MSLDRSLLDDTLHHLRLIQGDTAEVEVKRAAGGLPENIGETVCAFANTPAGGLLILGVDESDHFSVTGLRDAAVIMQGLIGVARDAVSPSPRVTPAIIDVDGLTVLMARVDPLLLSDRPARFEGRAYFRQGDGDHVMSEDDLRYLEAQKLIEATHVDHDLQPALQTSRADLDDDLVAALTRSMRADSRRLSELSEEDLLRMVGATDGDGRPTLAGVYALGRYPQGPFPQLTVTAAVRLPSGGTARTQNLRRFEGPLPDLLSDITAWIEQNLATRQTYTAEGHMRDLPEFPGRAVREAVANALVHRDLSPLTATRGIDIRIDDGALLILNPGRLSVFTVEQLMADHLTRSEVNRHLYRMAAHLRTAQGVRLIEGEGGGLLELFRSVRERGLKRPQLFDSGVTVTAKLWRGPLFDAQDEAWLARAARGRVLTAVQKRLLLAAREGERWDVGRIRREFSPLTVEDARDELIDLVSWGLVDVDQDTAILSISGSAPAQAALGDAAAARAGRGSARSRNADALLQALAGGPHTVQSFVDATGRTENQVRYALSMLLEEGRVRRRGGQGIKGTTYERV